jgi:uncharacterized alpha-E superfamily protein
MTFDDDNPNSLITCLTRARENARSIREVISSEMWEQLNTNYWTVRGDEARALFNESPAQLYRQIMSVSMLFQGLTDQTLAHDQRWDFAQLGKCLERITVTCRILRTENEIVGDDESEPDTPLWNVHWTTVLRSCCALEAYRRMYPGELDPLHILRFLILDDEFPRSIRCNVRRAYQAISAIRSLVRPHSVDSAERVLGRLKASLDYADPAELLLNPMSHLTRILDDVTDAALSVRHAYFLY